MRFILAFIIAGSVHCNAFSQNDYRKITVSGDLELIKLSENAYVHLSYSYLPGYGRFSSNGLIFIDSQKAFLFDTPMTDSLTKELVSWLNDSLKTEIAGFVPNHWHVDCMGGLGFLQKKNIESYANQITVDIARSKGLPVPDYGFKDSMQLMLGDKLINCYYFGAAHSSDNIVVWIPSEKILFAGCMIKSLTSQDLGNMEDGDQDAYPETIDKLIKRFPDAKIVIPGHGQFGGLELLYHTRDLLIR